MNRLFPCEDNTVNGRLAVYSKYPDSPFSRVKFSSDPLRLERSRYDSDRAYHESRLFFLHWQGVFREMRIEVEWDFEPNGYYRGSCDGFWVDGERIGAGIYRPSVVDLPSGKAIFVCESAMRVGDVQIKCGRLLRPNSLAADAVKGCLLTGSSGTAFMPSPFGFARENVSVDISYTRIPQLAARLLMAGSELRPVAREEDLEALIEVAIASERAGDSCEDVDYLTNKTLTIVHDLGVLDLEAKCFYAIPGISRMSLRARKERVRREILKSLQPYRAYGIRGVGLSRADIEKTIVGIICMYEPRASGSLVVHLPPPHDIEPDAWVSYRGRLGKQKRLERMILQFLAAGKVHGMSMNGAAAEMEFCMSTGRTGTSIERAAYIGAAKKRLSDLGITLPQIREAA